MTYQRVRQLAIVMRNVNADVNQEILENFLLPSLDEWLGDSSDFIFQDDNALKILKHQTKVDNNL